MRRRRRLQSRSSWTPSAPARSAPASTPSCSTATGPPGSRSAAATCWSFPSTASGAVRDLTPGTRDVPPFSLGGPDDYDISPDGKEVCYSMNADPVPATSTNSDLYVVSIGRRRCRARSPRPRAPTPRPQYSPDGKYLAWRAQTRAGYESDRWRLMVLERTVGPRHAISRNRSTAGSTASPGRPIPPNLFFTAGDRGRQNIQLISVNGGAARIVASGDAELDDMQLTRDGKTMVYTQQSGIVAHRDLRASPRPAATPAAMTHLNDAVLNGSQLTPLEEFFVERAGRRARAQLRREAVRVPGRPQIPGRDADPRRTAGLLGTRLDLSLERAGLRRRRIRGRDAQPARLHRLRPEVHRRDQRRLGRPRVRRHHGRRRSRRHQPALCRWRAARAPPARRTAAT